MLGIVDTSNIASAVLRTALALVGLYKEREIFSQFMVKDTVVKTNKTQSHLGKSIANVLTCKNTIEHTKRSLCAVGNRTDASKQPDAYMEEIHTYHVQ